MVTTDPIADLLTRIRNGITARHDTVAIPFSKNKLRICEILVEEGYLRGVEVKEKEIGTDIIVTLKYGAKYEKIISNIQRISKPGLRIYCKSDEIPRVLNGLGTVILSTSKGIMTGKAATNLKVGGEVLAYVW